MMLQLTARVQVASAVFTGSVLAIALTACTSEDADSTDPSTSEASASTFPEPEKISDPQSAAIAAYQRFWNTITAELAVPDGDFSALEMVASGQALEYAQSIEQRGVDEQVHGTGEFTHEIEVKESLLTDEAQQIVVTDCSDSSGTQVLDANDEPVAGEKYGPSHIEARIEHLDGRWLVTVIAVQEIGSCTPADS